MTKFDSSLIVMGTLKRELLGLAACKRQASSNLRPSLCLNMISYDRLDTKCPDCTTTTLVPYILHKCVWPRLTPPQVLESCAQKALRAGRQGWRTTLNLTGGEGRGEKTGFARPSAPCHLDRFVFCYHSTCYRRSQPLPMLNTSLVRGRSHRRLQLSDTPQPSFCGTKVCTSLRL